MAWFTCVEAEATTSVSNVPFCTNRGPTAWRPYTHPLICVEGNRCLLTGFQSGEVSTPALSPFLPQDPELPWLPKRLQAKTTPRRSPFPHNRSPSSLQCALVGFRVALLSQQLSASGSAVHSSQSLSRGPGAECPTQCPRGWSPWRHMPQRRTLPPGAGSHHLRGLSP